jgi:hypothetical protein
MRSRRLWPGNKIQQHKNEACHPPAGAVLRCCASIAGRGYAARSMLFLLLAALLCAETASAQFLPFGRNKIAYGRFDWQILKTAHFDIYYYPEMEDLARRGATFAEQSYSKLEQKFDYSIDHRIPLIFYSSPIHFQQTNVTPDFIPEGVGGFFEFLKGRVVIPSMGSLEQFRHVINHELTHVFMHNKVERALRDHSQPNEKYPPLWFVEGLAEFFSTGWDHQAEMLLRDAVLNGYFAPLSSIWTVSGSFLMYKEGQSALEFMAKEYGEESIVKLVDNIWRSADFNEVMKFTLGKSYEEFDREWTRDLKRRYFPLLKEKDRPSDASKEVVARGFNSKPVFYRRGDSTFAIHLANNTGYTGIYVTSMNGGESRLLVQGEKSDEFEAFHLFQSRMSVSRNGVLAFITKSGESDALHLFDLKSESILRSIAYPDLVMLGSVSWSPDGRRIVFSAIDRAGVSDMYVADTEDDRLLKLTNDSYDDREPAWSPDGTTIVFESDRASAGRRGVYNLFALDVESQRISYLTCEETNCGSPAWSPDGGKIVFTSDRDGTQNLYALDLRSARSKPIMRRITNFTTAAFDPVWTDKGGLLFTAFDAYSFQIRTIPDAVERFDSLAAVPAAAWDTAATEWSIPLWRGAAESSALKYEKEYQLDIAQSQISTDPVFGTMGGASLSMSDVLGNDRYNFLIYNTAQTSSEFLSSWNLAVSRISSGQRTPYAYGIYNFSGRRYDLLDPDLYFIERAFGGYFAAAYPLSHFQRIEGSVSITSSDKEALFEIRQRKALLLTNSVSFVSDNALYYYTGPIDGERFNVTLSSTMDVQYSNVNYYSVMADYRRYFRIALRSSLAARVELLYNEGKEARRYFLGGSWDLRGWPRWSIRGSKRWLASCELRFPLLDRVGFDFPFGGIDLGLLRGAVYADAGNAWDSRYDETLGSIGAGLRFSLFGILVLRYDFGKRIEGNFTRLQSDIFHQFFFGWDF